MYQNRRKTKTLWENFSWSSHVRKSELSTSYSSDDYLWLFMSTILLFQRYFNHSEAELFCKKKSLHKDNNLKVLKPQIPVKLELD